MSTPVNANDKLAFFSSFEETNFLEWNGGRDKGLFIADKLVLSNYTRVTDVKEPVAFILV